MISLLKIIANLDFEIPKQCLPIFSLDWKISHPAHFYWAVLGMGTKKSHWALGGKWEIFLILDGNSAFCSISKEVSETKQIADLGLLFSYGIRMLSETENC